MKIIGKKQWAGLLIALVALGAGSSLAAVDDPIVAVIKFLFNPFAEQWKNLEAGKKFQEATRYCIVISNESDSDWKFGYVSNYKDYANNLKHKDSGSLTIADVKVDGVNLWPAETLAVDAAPHLIRNHFGTVVITPVPAGMIYKEPVSRIAYLEDGAGKRLYLTLSKGTAKTDIPEIGLTGEGTRELIRLMSTDKKIKNPLHYRDSGSGKHSAIGINFEKLP